MAARFYQFGGYRLDAAGRVLYREEDRVPLTPKAVETLLLLVENRGNVVEKEELMRKIWPDTFVEEINLTRNISVLRKTLGDGVNGHQYIETIPKRGYRFIATVQEANGVSAMLGPAARQAAAVAAAVPQPGSDAQPASRAPLSRRAKAFLAGAAVAVLLLLGAIHWLTVGGSALSFGARDWILITDFENQTGDPRFDRALLTAFTVSLEQSRYANVFPRIRLGGVLQRMGKTGEPKIDEALGREICLRENLRGLVACSITRTGREYAVSARLIEPQSGIAVRSYTERVEGEDRILDALDVLARAVRRGLGESFYSIQRASRPLPQVTTPSFEALARYADAVALWRKRQVEEAIRLYQAALEADPDFAMAHAALGSAYFSHLQTNPAEGKSHFERALSLASRVTERERLYIQAEFASSLSHWDEAEQLYRLYLQAYPDDTKVQFDFANLLMRGRRLEEARARFQQVIRVDPTDAGAHIKLATCYGLEGRYAEALPHYARAFELEPAWITSLNLNHEYGVMLIGAGQNADARNVYALASATPASTARGLRSLALLDLYEGRYRDAQMHLRQAIVVNQAEKDILAEARNHLYWSIASEGQGDEAGELWELDAAARGVAGAGPAVWLMSYIGAGYARAGEVEKAMQMLKRARTQLDPQNPEENAYVHRLEGEIEVTRGNLSRGISLLQLAERESRQDLALVRDSLARAHEKAGNLESAIASYEALLAMRGGWLGWEPQQYWLADHCHLARRYVARGEKEKAKQRVQELLTLWKDADADLPLFQEALRLQKEIAQ